mgnify:CR=1 FL=1
MSTKGVPAMRWLWLVLLCVIAGCAPRYGSNSLIVCSHESWAHKGYEETPNEKLLLCYREDKGTW